MGEQWLSGGKALCRNGNVFCPHLLQSSGAISWGIPDKDNRLGLLLFFLLEGYCFNYCVCKSMLEHFLHCSYSSVQHKLSEFRLYNGGFTFLLPDVQSKRGWQQFSRQLPRRKLYSTLQILFFTPLRRLSYLSHGKTTQGLETWKVWNLVNWGVGRLRRVLLKYKNPSNASVPHLWNGNSTSVLNSWSSSKCFRLTGMYFLVVVSKNMLKMIATSESQVRMSINN